MTTATEAMPTWGQEEITEYTSPGNLAGGVAWELLTHDRDEVADLRLLKNLPQPAGLAADDMWSFLFHIIGEAGRIGYLVGKIDLDAFTTQPGEVSESDVTTERLTRAIAALIGTTIDEAGLYPWRPGDGLYEPAEDGAA